MPKLQKSRPPIGWNDPSAASDLLADLCKQTAGGGRNDGHSYFWASPPFHLQPQIYTPPDFDIDMADDQYNLPETPAHVFAIRAFKQAIFGTPKPVDDAELRRHTTANAARDRQANARPRTSDGPLRAPREDTLTLQSSPAKGILLTPGASGARRKTVSFGSGGLGRTEELGRTPKDVPGKFPSPWATKDAQGESGPAKRTKLTQAMIDARDGNEQEQELRKKEKNVSQPRRRTRTEEHGSEGVAAKEKQSVPSKPAHPVDASAKSSAENHPVDLNAPQSDSAQYWKQLYETYSANSTAEVLALAKKARMAKKYAKHKDSEALELTAQLEEAQGKLKHMETLLEEQKEQMDKSLGSTKDVQQALSRMHDRASRAEKEAEKLRQENEALKASMAKLRASFAPRQATEVRKENEAPAIPERSSLRTNPMLERSPRQQPSSPGTRASSLPPSAERRPNTNSRPAASASSDIWADFGIPSPSPPSRQRPYSLARTTSAQAATTSSENKVPLQAAYRATHTTAANVPNSPQVYSPPSSYRAPDATTAGHRNTHRTSSNGAETRSTSARQPLRQRIANLNDAMDATEARVGETENKLAAAISRTASNQSNNSTKPTTRASTRGSESTAPSRSASGVTARTGPTTGLNMTEERRDAAMKRLEERMAKRRNKQEGLVAAIPV